MALSSSLEASADAILDDVVSQLSSIQGSYKTSNGKYWQGVSPVTGVPEDGNTLPVDMTKKPTDQSENWNDVSVTLDNDICVSVKVFVYDGPSGHGYVVCGEVVEGGATYTKAVNVGPETYRNQAWSEITEV